MVGIVKTYNDTVLIKPIASVDKYLILRGFQFKA